MPTLKDLTGQTFGLLTVVNRAPNKNNRTMWHCRCECGNECDIRTDQLTRGVTKSCGCLHSQQAKSTGQNNKKDLTGQTFGLLTVLYELPERENGKILWMCQCACGNTRIVRGTSLTSGNTQSCGCIKSRGEAEIKKILNKANLNYKSQYAIKVNTKTYFYDFAILNGEQVIRLIEFDGPQHNGRISGWFTEERYEQLKQSDKIKNTFAFKNNIPLVRIPYQEKDNLSLELLLSDKYLMEEAQDLIEEDNDG